MKLGYHHTLLIALLLVFVSLTAASRDEDILPPLMTWAPPAPGEKVGIIDGLDQETLAALTESGALQYFQPRHEEGLFDVVAGMMIHAPAEVVWEVATDYMAMCRILDDTFNHCETVSNQGNTARMHYKIHTSVLKFTFNMDITDEITTEPPYKWHLETVEGELKGRELDLLLIPMGEDRTMAFLRYFGALRSMGALIRLTLAIIPDVESPIYASAATYHLRAYKNEAERRAGYQPPHDPAAIDYSGLKPETLHKLCRWYAGLVRETPEGKTINAMAFTSIDRPQETVWEVMTDFENYNRIFPDSNTIVESRSENEAVLRQNIKQLDVYLFSFGFDLHAKYTLDGPSRMSYVTLDGLYKDTRGDFVLSPYDNGQQTFVFASIGAVLERDKSLTMRIVRSGAFPFDSVANLFFARDVLNKLKIEADKR